MCIFSAISPSNHSLALILILTVLKGAMAFMTQSGLIIKCSCCSIVYLRFHVKQIIQVDCKISTKNMELIINKRHSVIFLDNCTHKSIKPRKRR